MRRICAVLVTLTACTAAPSTPIAPFLNNAKADGPPPELQYEDRSGIDVDEPSDLVQVDGHLYTVSDSHTKIYEVEPDGDTDKYLDIDVDDLESIGFDPVSGEFLVGDEGSGKVWFIDDDGDNHDSIEIDGAEDGNSGIEGLVVTPAGHLFVVKEKDPTVIYELDLAGNLLSSDEVDFAGDLSAITYNPADGHLYVLSDQEQALYRLTSSLVPDLGWSLPVDKPEGLAFDGNTLYVVSDSEDRIYTFDFVP